MFCGARPFLHSPVKKVLQIKGFTLQPTPSLSRSYRESVFDISFFPLKKFRKCRYINYTICPLNDKDSMESVNLYRFVQDLEKNFKND